MVLLEIKKRIKPPPGKTKSKVGGRLYKLTRVLVGQTARVVIIKVNSMRKVVSQ